jgi:hypothetical protein
MRLHNVFVTLAVGALSVYIHQLLKKKGRLVWLARFLIIQPA